jgi:hypothetical protein
MPNDRPLNFDQAINKIKEDDKLAPAILKAEAAKQDISLALPDDRKKYLLYCVSLLHHVDSDLMRKLPENIRTIYSGREMAEMVKVFLSMQIHGASKQFISKKTGIPMNIIEDFDFMAQIAIKRAIAIAKEKGIALL